MQLSEVASSTLVNEVAEPEPVETDQIQAELEPESESEPEEPAASPEPVLLPLSGQMNGIVTHYGPQFNGQILGCGTGYYTSDNPVIAAVGPARNREWPCGTIIRICGPAGCLDSVRHDSCPGCGPTQIDLSEAGIAIVCGNGAAICKVQLQAFARPKPDTGLP